MCLSGFLGEQRGVGHSERYREYSVVKILVTTPLQIFEADFYGAIDVISGSVDVAHVVAVEAHRAVVDAVEDGRAISRLDQRLNSGAVDLNQLQFTAAVDVARLAVGANELEACRLIRQERCHTALAKAIGYDKETKLLAGLDANVDGADAADEIAA